jgi:hydrogenase maturation protein HypF
VNGEYVQLIRRARGLVPEPIEIKQSLKQDTFAAGGDLKASFALGRDHLVYMSQYFGDLEDVRCIRRREEAYEWMKELLEIEPSLTVGDLHPSYVSARNTQMKIQHHHAHVASVIAEHGLEGKVLGIACDGTGFGTDGTIWGCEIFLYEDGAMTREGRLSPVKLLGGDASAKDADLTLFSYWMEACNRGMISEPWHSETENSNKYMLQTVAWKQNINTVYSSSLGRLFDAVAAVLDICHYNSYEGECAILLEQAAHKGKEWFQGQKEKHPEDILSARVEKTDSLWQIDGVQLMADIKRQYDLNPNQRDLLAYAFHISASQALTDMAKRICQESGVTKVALSGGSFINRLLLSQMTEKLKQCGYEVYINEKVPCGDGGIALGQMFLNSLT